MGPHKFLIFSGCRADYGLIRWVFLEANRTHNTQAFLLRMNTSEDFQLIKPFAESGESLIQLAPRQSINGSLIHIEQEEILLSYNAVISRTFTALRDLNCDCLVVLGDRLEMHAAVIAAAVLCKPVVHLCGGDVGEGTIDNSVRAAVTQMSSLHLVTSEDARARVVRFGIEGSRVFNTGSLAIDGWLHRNRRSRVDILDSLGFGSDVNFCVVTIHPCPFDSTPFPQIAETLDSLVSDLVARGLKVVFTLPNQDLGSREISNFLIQLYRSFPDDVRLFEKVGHDNYLGLLEHAKVCIGNSSSGVYEAPLARTPTVDIGIRQRGRLRGDSVVSCGWSPAEVRRAINRTLNERFEFTYPYGDGPASKRIVREILKFLSEHPGRGSWTRN